MKYDDASWHYGGDFPAGLPDDAGGKHIGMFLAWCLLNGLGGELHRGRTDMLRDREVTPGQFLIAECDAKLTDEDLSVEGNAFTSAYYGGEGDSFSYYSDFSAALNADGRLPSDYHVVDSWENYDKLCPVIRGAYEDWKRRTPGVASPAERFYRLCGEVAEAVKRLGYRYARSGPYVSRRRVLEAEDACVAPKSEILHSMDCVLHMPGNFVGIIDENDVTLQFMVNDDKTIHVDVPVPAKRGSSAISFTRAIVIPSRCSTANG